jgi:outer membrane receptor protein involved in Fe transport
MASCLIWPMWRSCWGWLQPPDPKVQSRPARPRDTLPAEPKLVLGGMTVSKGRIRCLAGAALLLAGPALAGTDAPGDAEILVTATPLFDVGEGLLAAPAQGATDEDLAAMQVLDASDWLRRLAGGVSVNELTGNPLQADVNFRGFTASPLLGTPQGLGVWLDGVRLNQPFGDVVSWDMIPLAAIRSISLVPGSNPLFGRNAIGGALAIRTKDGRSDPGMRAQAMVGSFGRRTFAVDAGGRLGGGFDWFIAGNHFAEDGWREASPSMAWQGLAKLGWHGPATDISLSAMGATSRLTGNGLQEQRLLAADRASVFTTPDTTRNRLLLLNLVAEHRFSDRVSLKANAFWRRIRTSTLNGDINEGALGENVYQPNAAERAALAAAGYTGFPLSGETQANTPFPRWRCIANVLLNSEPNEKCTGLIGTTQSRQDDFGGNAELAWAGRLAGVQQSLTLGAGLVLARSDFGQAAQFGYLLPDRSVMPVAGPGMFADGSQNSENAFDARVDLNARTDNASLYALDHLAIADAFSLDVSARLDHGRVRNRDRIAPGGGSGSLDGDHRFTAFNPAASLAWQLARRISLDAAIARTSRMPSAIELGCADPAAPCRLPNAMASDPPLQQVRATTIEAGVRLGDDRLNLRLGGFRTTAANDILFVASEQTGFGYFRNFGSTRRQGLEVDAQWQGKGWQLRAHYTWLDATYRSAETVGGAANSSNDGPAPGFDGNIAIRPGDRIPLLPRHVLKLGGYWTFAHGWTLNGDMQVSSGAPARGNENGQHQPDGVFYLGPGATRGFAVLNLGLAWSPAPAFTLLVQVDNVLDAHFNTAAALARTGLDAQGQFVARPFAGPVIAGERPQVGSSFFAPGAPRQLRAGLRLRF